MRLDLLPFAAKASAFLVVPELSETTTPDEGAFKALPIDATTNAIPVTAASQSLHVPCRQCRGHDTTLRFDFEVQEETRLLLNGFELYPNADPWNDDLVAAVSTNGADAEDEKLGYALGLRWDGIDEKQGMELLGVNIRVVEVGKRFVQGVPPVNVQLVVGPKGELFIANVKMEEDITHNDDEPECESMWCRMSELWGNMFKGSFGCHRAHKQGVHNAVKAAIGHGHGPNASTDGKHGGHKAHHGPYRHHGQYHHGHGHYGKLVKNLASHIFLPVIMGITAGVGVAALAMLVCSAMFRMVSIILGRDSRESLDDSMDVVIVEEQDEEKRGLVRYQSPPPEYREPVEKA